MIDLTPTSIKGGVERVIDSATGDIARTTSGWIEDEKYGWFATQYATAWSAEFDSAVTRTGRLTVKLSTTDATGRVRASHSLNSGASNTTAARSKYEIPLKSSTAYKLSCFVKTNNVAAASAFVAIFLQTSSYVYTQVATTNKLSGNNDWTEVTASFTTGATIATGRIELFNDVAGNISDAWFDVNSMTLEEVSTITNSGSSPALLYPKVTAVSSTDNIDQSQVAVGTGLAFADDAKIKIGQVFTPTKKNATGYIFRRETSVGTFTGDVTITLEATTSGLPNGTVLETFSYTNAQWEAITRATDVTLSFTRTLTPGTVYAVTFTASTQDASNYPRIFGDAGSTGRVLFGTSWSASTAGSYFKTLYSKNTTNFTVSTSTESLTVTSPTVDGWENGDIIDTSDGTYGITPLTLVPGSNTVYYSSNGPATADGEVDPSLQATIDGTADEVRLDATIRPLNKDTDNEPIQDAPAPYQSARRTIIENQPVSSCISLNVSTTTLEVGAFGGQGALIRWIPKTETDAVSPFASVIASGADVNYDHYIPPSEFRRFAVPRESSAPSVSPTGVAYVKYKRVAIINAGIVASSILVAEY
jgi:hypothetical protein